jgi:hypothetical protein
VAHSASARAESGSLVDTDVPRSDVSQVLEKGWMSAEAGMEEDHGPPLGTRESQHLERGAGLGGLMDTDTRATLSVRTSLPDLPGRVEGQSGRQWTWVQWEQDCPKPVSPTPCLGQALTSSSSGLGRVMLLSSFSCFRFYFATLGFELRALRLLGRFSTT